MPPPSPAGPSRRGILAASVATIALVALEPARARIVKGSLPWAPGAAYPPVQVRPGPWVFFTPEEGATVEALVDRLIPPDDKTPGGKGAGCAVFIDHQLAGPFGSSAGLYMRPPFSDGTPEQGAQSPLTPAERYRRSLAALEKHCHDAFAGKAFGQIPADQQDKIIAGLESGQLQLGTASGKGFFDLLLQNTKEGFFADPIYGGNKDMAGWRMIGFPGVRYDFRDWVEHHNEAYPHPPVSLIGRPDWVAKNR